MFQPQTKATAILKDGTELNLSKISIRATEFTDGKVIKIISVDNNKAQVDTTGDGIADNTGIKDDELNTLAKTYEAGKELWRVEISQYYFNDMYHLKAYDINGKITTTLTEEMGTESIYEKNALYYSSFNSISMIIDGKVKKVLNEYDCEGDLFHVMGFVVNSDGEVYAIDAGKNLLIKVSQDGFVTKISGNCNSIDGSEFSDGDGESVYDANFNQISKITIDSNDNIYIMEKNGNIRQISKDGIVTSKLKFIEDSMKSIDEANIGDNISDFYVLCGGFNSSCKYLLFLVKKRIILLKMIKLHFVIKFLMLMKEKLFV